MAENRPFSEIAQVPAEAGTLAAISRLRVAVWEHEGTLAPEIAASGRWLDDHDPVAQHWVVRDAHGELVAAARMTMHDDLAASLDGYVWTDAGRTVPTPFASLSRLVVHPSARGRGLADALNRARVEAAKALGAKAITSTASAANARLLARAGFVDTGLTVVFANRPGTVFHALELVLR